MEALGGAASVIAVVQIAEQVLTLCYEYSKSVKHAPSEIGRLQDEVGRLISVLKGAQVLIEGPYMDKLKTSQRLLKGLGDSKIELETLNTKLKKTFEEMTRAVKNNTRRFLGLGPRLKWPLQKEEVEETISRLRKHRDDINAGLTIDHVALALEGFERIEDHDRLEILDWMSPIQYGEHHRTVKEARTADTCDWLLSEANFGTWKADNSAAILWLQGSPGVGKTFLTSKVIDDIQGSIAAPDPASRPEGFAYFYCNRNEESRRQPISVLQSYARQLATAAHDPKMMQDQIRGLWQNLKAQGNTLGLEACKTLLLDSVKLYTKTTMVLDALDECEPSSRWKILDLVEFLVEEAQKASRPLHVFISSRPDTDIRMKYQHLPNVEIQATDNEEDIRRFVNKEIARHRRWDKMKKQLRHDIVETLVDRSRGMFQWAFLQIRQLLELQMEDDIRDRLGKLPDSLKAAYDEIYGKISSNKHQKIIADAAFKWTLCAMEPLSTGQLLDAVRIDVDNPGGLSKAVDSDLLLDLCGNLLVLDSQLHVWRFSHLSVAEYFEDNHWGRAQAHCYAAKVCLCYLLEEYKVPHKNRDRRSFDAYCSENWVCHVQTQEDQRHDTLLFDLLQSFLGDPMDSSDQYHNWVSKSKRNPALRQLADGGLTTAQLYPTEYSALLASRYALFNTLPGWWQKAELLASLQNKNGTQILFLAAMGGSIDICKELIQRGANVNEDNPDGSALTAAVSNGNLKLVQYLVEHGADVNLSCGGIYRSALAAAAYGGNLKVVQYLVEHGADVNQSCQGYFGSAPVAAATRENNLEVVQYLVEHGADVNLSCGGIYKSALAAAAYGGNLKVVQYLVEHGADVNQSCQVDYGSALVAAAYGENLKVVQYLVEHGADVNQSCQGDYGSALDAAAYEENLKVVQYLLEHGASFEEGKGESALDAPDSGSMLSHTDSDDGEWDSGDSPDDD